MRKIFLILVFIAGFIGCASEKPAKIERPYSVATTQTASQPVYYPARFVRHPQPKVKTPVKVSKEKIMPVMHYDLPNSSLCEISSALAASLRYSSYCESSLNDIKLNVNLLGTPFELADMIMKETGIYVSLDIENREVRFLSNKVVTPEL